MPLPSGFLTPARLAPCDVVLVEGYKGFAGHPRLEVYRATGATPAAPLAASDPGIGAIAWSGSPPAGGWPAGTTRLDLDDTGAIADYLLAR